VLGPGNTGAASVLRKSVGSWWPSMWLPRNCIVRTLDSSPILDSPCTPWVVCQVHDCLGDWILGHYVTTHLSRLVRSLWILMYKIAFLLQMYLVYVECTINVKWKFLPSWFLGAELKKLMWPHFSVLLARFQTHVIWTLCCVLYSNWGPWVSNLKIAQEFIINAASQATPRMTGSERTFK
jgi:hypothetical protein